MRAYSSRVMLWPLAVEGSSVTMYVLPALREVTRVCTFTLSNSVMRQLGISSVNALSSSGDGLSWTCFASTDTSAPVSWRDHATGGEPILPNRPVARTGRAAAGGYLDSTRK